MPDPSSFLPSQDGLAFTNAWPSEPAVVLPTPFGKINIGNAAAGLCGGMVFAALDFWQTGIQPPATRPAPGEPLYRYIVQRLVDSWHLPAGVAQYYQWMNLPDGDSGFEAFGRRVVTDRRCIHGDGLRGRSTTAPRTVLRTRARPCLPGASE